MENINELIPIQENNGQRAVNARDLHAFLQVGKDFSNWIKGRVDKYDFVEGKDFEVLYFDYRGNLLNIRHAKLGDSENQQVSKIEYALSISMAKELSMLENNERGKQARKYFIACEENKRELSRKELLLMALQAEEEKERLEIENRQKQQLLEQKTEQLDESKEWYSIKRWAKEHGMNWRSINWRKMKALSYELGYDIKKVFDANYGQVNIYNVKVFEAYL
jgi:phage anti-repressor protein|nr:MAG TPA: AntA/AntB antirepressor [Caudoviricetes sp.]